MQIIDREMLKKSLGAEGEMSVVNVLPKENYDKEHIKGSENVPLEDEKFEQKVEAIVGSKDKSVVVYCANFDCLASKHAAEKLEQAGFTNVRAYEGGLKDWKEADYAVEGNA